MLTMLLVGGLEHFSLFHILGIIIATNFHMFQRGGSTTHQSGLYRQKRCPLLRLSMDFRSRPRAAEADLDQGMNASRLGSIA